MPSHTSNDHHAFVETLEPRVLLSTLTVTNANDSGAGSLRRAILDANTAAGADVIEFDGSLSGGTITLTSGELEITDDLTINGLGRDNLTLSGGFASRIFRNDATTTISGLTVTGGWTAGDGGAVFNSGALTLDGVSVTDSLALMDGGGVAAYGGSLLLVDSSVSSNTSGSDGGGVYFEDGVLTVLGSTFTDNTATDWGGGIVSRESEATIEDSEITGNTSVNDYGGGIYNEGTLLLTRSTISGNTAAYGGGLYSSNWLVECSVTSSTITGNTSTAGEGGGVYLASGDVTIANTTISNNTSAAGGSAGDGGGVYADNGDGSSLELRNCTISGNHADGEGGGVYNASSGLDIEIWYSTVESNTSGGRGGGIACSYGGSILLSDSSVSSNSTTSHGGGVSAEASTLFINRSTVSDNSASGDGGGIFLTGSGDFTMQQSTVRDNTSELGGGIYLEEVTVSITGSTVSGNAGLAGGGIFSRVELTIDNSTFSGNAADATGGAIFSTEAVAISNSTITMNGAADFGNEAGPGEEGGGIFSGGSSLTLTSTILAGNTGQDDVGSEFFGGSIDPSSSHNLIGDAATAGGLTDGASSNIVGADPMLGDLADNGGPTMTHALLAGSPAINAGSNTGGLTTDQRGTLFSRASGAPDIGAYERQSLALTVDNAGDDSDGDYTAGNLSLREAVGLSNANPLDDSIEFDSSLTSKTITLVNGFLTISGNVEITGPGRDDLAISGGGSSRHFRVSDDDSGTTLAVTITGLRLTNGLAGNRGGSISNDENLTLDGMKLNGNIAVNSGGAIYNRGTMTITDSIINNNSSTNSGGAIDNGDGSTLTISGSTLKNNSSDRNGGVIDNDPDSTLIISNSTLENNAAAMNGGAINNDAGASLVISGSTLSSNTTGTTGGAIDNSGSLEIANSTLNNNTSTDTSTGYGGAIHNQAGGTLTISDSTLNGNSGVAGGAIENAGTATITGSTLDGNSAEEAGGAIDNFGGVLTISRSTLSNNSVNGSGGAIWTDTALTITNSTISGNSAGGWGGGIGMYDGTVVISNSTIAFNVADTDGDGRGQGGGIDVGRRDGAGTLTTSSTIYAGNTRGAAATVLDDISLTDGTVSGTNNLVQDPATAGGLTHGANGNLVGLDPGLGSLAFNEGNTRSHAIFPRSPAIDAGTANTVVSFDQRGLDRVYGDAADIGAFEWQPTEFPLFTAGGSVESASQDDNSHSVAIRNINGDIVVFRNSGDDWIAERLADHVDAPGPFGTPLIWTDPADGLIYVAGSNAQGFLLFQRGDDGIWTLRNLSTELGLPDEMPYYNFTQFVTTDGLVSVAGFNADRELILLQQTGDTGPDGAVWSLRNLSDDLTSRGMTTPDLAYITSYVTPWNQWTIAGIDLNGDIQGIWVNVATFTTWRVDNLSDLYGTPTLSGQLTVIQTSWKAINLAGTDADGNVIVTWWVPSFKGSWAVSDLTESQGGTPLASGRITGWVTSWGAMNFAGLDADGEVVAYWWTPGTPWTVSTLTGNLGSETIRPTSSLDSHVSDAGTMNIVGTDDNSGNVLRLWWTPNDDGRWKLNDLTELAVRT